MKFLNVDISKQEEIIVTSVIVELANGNRVTNEDVLHKLILNTDKIADLESQIRKLKRENIKLKKLMNENY